MRRGVCPSCGEAVQVPGNLLGQDVRCPACQSEFPSGAISKNDFACALDSRASSSNETKIVIAVLVLGVLMLLGTLGLIYVGTQTKWYADSCPEGWYNIAFPARRQEMDRPVPGRTGESRDVHIRWVQTHNGAEAYSVSYSDMPMKRLKSASKKTLMREDIESIGKEFPDAVPILDAKGVANREINLAGWPGYEFAFSLGTRGELHGRIFLVHDRMFVLTAIRIDGKEKPRSVDQFFDSFVLTHKDYKNGPAAVVKKDSKTKRSEPEE